MFRHLVPHPASRGDAVTSVQACLEIKGDVVIVRFILQGDLDEIVIAEKTAPCRRDGLWQSTCCEIYLQHRSRPQYFEFNFSPSREWAAYGFARYRNGRYDLLDCHTEIELALGNDIFEMIVMLDPGFAATQCANIGLSAIIEEKSGDKSYWALAHAPGEPDFHNAISFVIDVEDLRADSCSAQSVNGIAFQRQHKGR